MTTERLEQWWGELVAAKLLHGKQAEVLHALVARGPATSGEILDAFHQRNMNAWRGRFSELAARGLIREVAYRKCKVGGRMSIVWAPTGRTKPLDPHKGTGGGRSPGALRAKRGWREIADRLASALERYGLDREVGIQPTRQTSSGASVALAAYRKMVRA